MKKIIISFGIVVAIVFLLATVWAWDEDKVFFRVPAKITINGVNSEKSALYRSRNSEYFLILHGDKTELTTLWIGKGKIGVPSDIVPSIGTLSFQTDALLVCLDAEIDILGEMGWESVNPRLSMSDEDISFQIKGDTVIIKF